MVNLKKINQLRTLPESIVTKPRSTTGIKSMGVGGADHSDRDDGYDPFIPKTDKDKRIKAALDKMGQQYKSGKPFTEAKDPREYDYEGDMAKSQLRSIIANAQEVHDMLEDNTNIAEWVQSKITLSADYITTVRDYMNSEVNEASDPKMTKPSLLTRVKKMNKQNKERSQAAFSNMFGGGNPASSLSIRKKSTNEEVDQLDEVMFGDKRNKQALVALLRHSELAMAAKKDGDHQAVKYHQTKMDNIRNQMAKPANEEAELDEAVSKAKDLKTLLTRHSELAVAANKDGDHEAVKYHQAKMNAVKNQMAKLAKEEVEPIHEISKELAKSYLDKTVDPVYGMPKHGMKDRMKGIRQASIRVLKKAGKPKTN